MSTLTPEERREMRELADGLGVEPLPPAEWLQARTWFDLAARRLVPGLLADLDAAEARLVESEALVAEARAVLDKVEWGGDDDGGDYCPVCSNYRDSGHKPDCALAVFLAKTAPKEGAS